jgi:hypothetical protein
MPIAQAGENCGLTPRSSGAPAAGHQARAGGTRYIFTSPGPASCRWLPLSSNVRHHTRTPHKLMRILVLLFALVVCPALAQVSGQSSVTGSSFKPPASGSLILLLPPSTEAPELDAGVATLLQALHSELAAAGFRTALLDKANYETIWAQEVEAVGGIYDSRTGSLKPVERALAIAALTKRLAQETSASLVITPRLVLRKAELSGTKASWDGRLVLVPTRGTFGGSSSSTGTTTAVSVQLLALARDGTLAFNTFGGVTLPYAINFVSERPELREKIFSDKNDLAKAAEIALGPLTKK